MDTSLDFSHTPWFANLDPTLQRLISESRELLLREERLQSSYTDYAFVVFPMAKAYEGFLRSFFVSMGVVNHTIISQKQFRIGRSFNPDLSSRYRDEYWIFDDIERLCSPGTARQLWDTWIECRNHLFHFFPDDPYAVTLPKARKLLLQLAESMQLASACTIEHKH